MSYSFNQKRKAKRRKLRETEHRTAAVPKGTPPNPNPSRVISLMAQAESSQSEKHIRYWDYIRKNYKRFGGPAPIRVEMAQVVAEIDRVKAEKRKEKHKRQAVV